MKLTQRYAEPPFTTTIPASHGGAQALALSAEAVRLSWNRASSRIIHEAQERVALQSADTLKAGRQ
jgi:hypothetical protein